MAEYIKREDAIDICTKCVDFQDSIENINASAEAMRIRRLIKEMPSADVVERKHGKWEMKPDPYGFFDEIPVCSECGCTTKMREKYNFCPNCGADMRGGKNV